VNAGTGPRALANLDLPLDEALGPESATAVQRALADPASGDVIVGPHGLIVAYASAGRIRRRVLELDRDGAALAMLRWIDDRLAAAWVRVPDGSWLAIEPRVTTEAPWGLSDGLSRAERPGASGAPLTVFETLDWSRIDRIPTLAAPAALPAGGGGAVLNLLAALATDQGCPRLFYRGPYPTEALFLALLEAFRYEAITDDPLAAFTRGTLGWIPAPHVRRFTAEGAYVQLRGRIDKVVWRGRAYYRADWQGVARHSPHRVRDAPDGVRCSLWALGAALEDHLVLTSEGDVSRLVTEPPPAADVRALPPAVAAGVGAVVATLSAPPLRAAVQAEARALTLEWGPVTGDLFGLEADRARLSARLRARLQATLGEAASPEARAAMALAALSEIALLLGDALRARGQERVAALPEVEQRVLLTSPPLPDATAARLITGAVEALLLDSAAGEKPGLS
jgi:hypothetical protein